MCNFYLPRGTRDVLFFERSEKNNNSRVPQGKKDTFYRLILFFIIFFSFAGKKSNLPGKKVTFSPHIAECGKKYYFFPAKPQFPVNKVKKENKKKCMCR